jgi:hypothetical protein
MDPLGDSMLIAILLAPEHWFSGQRSIEDRLRLAMRSWDRDKEVLSTMRPALNHCFVGA